MAEGKTARSDAACPLCSGTSWLALPDIRPDRSVRTDGGVVPVPLSKRHCAGCGLAVRRAQDDLAALYAEDYQLYANRPGADLFDAGRYRKLVELLAETWGEGAPRRVLEAGCGDGGLARAMQLRWPEAEVIGVEPSAAAVALGQAQGFPVVQGMIGQATPDAIVRGGFDLIYSIHVVEHTPDPSVFLRDLSVLLASRGRIVVTCPDGAVPHAELIHPDHLFSMTRTHLAAFARRGGLRVLAQGDCPGGVGAEFSQMLVCAPAAAAEVMTAAPQGHPGAAALFEARCAYLQRWRELEATLMAPVVEGEAIYCFGAGGWAGNLAANCPNLWARVVACAIDGGAKATVQGKPVVDYATLADRPRHFLAAVNPAIQERIAARLTADGHAVLPWPKALAA